jgi:alpha-methylacyl-CoA racemase
MGPLAGVRIVEFAGIGPGPMAAMLFADLGASVIRIDRTLPSGLGIAKPPRFDLTLRSRPSVSVDLKHPEGLALALDLLADADALIEGFRPGKWNVLGSGLSQCCNETRDWSTVASPAGAKPARWRRLRVTTSTTSP